MIYTNSDGGARGNPGPGAIGVIVRKDNQILKKYSAKIGRATNNVAEYKALIKALELALKYTKTELTCILDSELVTRQLTGKYRVKNPQLKKLFSKAKKLEKKFKKVKYRQVSRWNKFQRIPDSLLNEELGEK